MDEVGVGCRKRWSGVVMPFVFLSSSSSSFFLLFVQLLVTNNHECVWYHVTHTQNESTIIEKNPCLPTCLAIAVCLLSSIGWHRTTTSQREKERRKKERTHCQGDKKGGFGEGFV